MSRSALDLKLMMAALTASMTARVLRGEHRATVEILSATVKHVRPYLRSVQIKFGKQGKFHFS